MTVRRAALAVAATLALAGATQASGQPPASTAVPSIELSGEISPATEAWMGSALSDAAAEDASLAIIRLDTPGGLDSSMRAIVKDIIAAPMPVVVYVTPPGARAASAGVFITEAADVAAMAPETNIGSASPISSTGEDFGDTLGRKITNDAAALVRALATSHGRNPELAEEMVREATNVTSTEALDAGLIDIVASDQEDLLAQLDGFRVQGPKAVTLQTEGLSVSDRDMPIQYELLQVLVNPNVAFLLLLIGFVGITLEFFAPGMILPGAIGVIALLLGIFGTVQLPVEAIGVVLLVLGIGLIIAEANLPTGGLLGVVGVGALIAGGLLLFDTGSEEFAVSPGLVVGVAGALGLGLVFVGHKAMQARRRPVSTGQEELLASVAEVRTPLDPIGQVFVEGALWRARVAASIGPIEAGCRVRIDEIDGLTLVVTPLEVGSAAAADRTLGGESEGAS
jgi:membrane-bound serine protease (ClpP class)